MLRHKTPLTRHSYTSQDLSGTEWVGVDFTGCNFSDTDLTDCRFVDCTLARCDFTGAVLRGARIVHPRSLVGARLSEADLTDSIIRDARFDDGALSGAILTGSRWERVDACRQRFEWLDLSRTVWKDCRLRYWQATRLRVSQTALWVRVNASMSWFTDVLVSAPMRVVGLGFVHARLVDADVRQVRVEGADCTYAVLENVLWSPQRLTGVDRELVRIKNG